jgi:phosphinothricin acetyltransferase
MAEVLIRTARAADVPALSDIYNHYVRTSPATFDIAPVTLESRLAWFSHYAHVGPYRLLAAEFDGLVIGYASSSPLAARAAYVTSVETSIYLRPEACGQGLGGRLYAALFASLGGEDVHRAYAQVTLPNPASIALHQRFGFRAIGIQGEVGRKFGRFWSVQLLEKHLT